MLQRKVGYDYPEIGFAYRVILRKGIANILFDGIITKIDESHGAEGDQIMVNCVGWNTLLAFDKLNVVLSDVRLNRWARSEDESGLFVPKKFDTNTSWNDDAGDSVNGLQFKPRRGVDFLENEYTYMRYTFEFGETVARITYDYDVAFPASWPGKMEVLDASGTVLHSETATASGSKNLPVSGGSYIEIRFYVTDAGENTAEDGTIYVRFTDVTIYSTEDTVDMARVAREVVSALATNFGTSSDTSKLAATGYTLPQAAFDGDMTMAEIMQWCSKFGGRNQAPLAWGMELNDKRRFFVELQDTATIKYRVPRKAALTATVSGDWASSYQKLYTVTQDAHGNVVRSSVTSSETQIEKLGGLYRKEALSLGQITSAQASQAASYALEENTAPKVSSSFNISAPIETESSAEVPLDEIKAGGIVEIPDFRGREATLTPNDLRTGFTSFMLVGVEIDLDAGTAMLIPAGDRNRFEAYMATLAKVAGGV